MGCVCPILRSGLSFQALLDERLSANEGQVTTRCGRSIIESEGFLSECAALQIPLHDLRLRD